MSKSEIIAAVRRAEVRKQRLVRRLGPVLPSAFDGDELAVMSARQLARKVLAKLGIEYDTDDPVAALESYLEGHESARRDRAGGMDAAARGGTESFVDEYLNG